MTDGGVLVALGALLELLKDHKPIPCGDELAHKDGARPMLESSLGVIDKDRSASTDAAVYACTCGWTRTERLKPNI